VISLIHWMRLVLDTDVMVAAFRSDQGASRQLLLAALDRRFVLLASVPLMLEYEAVLTRPDQLHATGLTVVETVAVLEAVAGVVDRIQLRFLWRPRLRDPADEMVLETAVNGRADRLVTFNVVDFIPAAQELDLRVRKPGEIWRELKSGDHEKK